MAEQKMALMNSDFARWLGEVTLVEGAAAARWTAIDEFVSAPSRETVEVLVRLAFETKAPAGGHKDPVLAGKLKEFHDAFDGADGYDPAAARENQILAASALVKLFESYSPASHAVTIAGFSGARDPALPMDIVGLAEQAIKQLGAARRVRPDISSLKIHCPVIDAETELQANDPPAIGKGLQDLKDAAENALEAIVDDFNLSTERMANYLRVADEELQMLWWLIGGRSIDLDLDFGKVEPTAQPLIFARELANLTAATPGPLAIESIMARAGLKSRGRVSVVEAVNAVSTEWATSAVENLSTSPATTPIHYALDKRVEAGEDDAWAKGWSAITGLKEDVALPAVKLSEFFYRERLFLSHK